jgi:isoleucyl-tRNA synthetase
MGIDKYNEHCRSIVMRCAEQWEHVVERVGRWIDFRQDYKTMDVSFMESVWWVFKQLFEKNLVYRGFKGVVFVPCWCLADVPNRSDAVLDRLCDAAVQL